MTLLRTAAAAAFLVSYCASQVVINEVLYDPAGVDTGEERIELKNIGSTAVDLSGYDLYPDGIGYFTFPSLTLPAGSCCVVHLRQTGSNSVSDVYHETPTSNLGNSSGSVALFNGTTHSSSTLASFVQWGAGGKAWSSAATSAGFWTSVADSVAAVAEGHSIEYDGTGISPSDWFDQSSPTIGSENALAVTWKTFEAVWTARGVELVWTTAEEKDNFGFHIERQLPRGRDWKSIGFVQASTNPHAGATYRFLDTGAVAGRCRYRLVQVDRSGSRSVSPTVEADVPSDRSGFLRGYPNPFNPNATIEFRAEAGGPTNVEVFDLSGSRVAVLFAGRAEPGVVYRREFEAGGLSSGVYIVRTVTAGSSRIVRMVLVR